MQPQSFAEAIREVIIVAVFIGGGICLARMGGQENHDLALLLVGAAAGFAGSHRKPNGPGSATTTPPPLNGEKH